MPVIGASGMVSEVHRVYLLLFTHARVLLLLRFGVLTKAFYVPAMLGLRFRFLLQILRSLAAPAGTATPGLRTSGDSSPG